MVYEMFLEYCIVRALKRAGFERADPKSLKILTELTTIKIHTMLSHLSIQTSQAKRQNTTMIDIFNTFKVSFKEIENYSPLHLEFEMPNEENNFISSVASYGEKPLHIYDYMPVFPATHTFKHTFIKEKKKDDRPKNIKQRVDQSLNAETNLFKLLNASRDIPPYINFMF
ncbi:hypothetical protein TCON_1295 [Astathelohania contejeani]|uniref:Transcription initiation factor TFIID subunit 8 n=1 Tax=Astathelohania contejeani TaxID=164912 RepID=A0ABQ7HZE9_9MICR|nr:hypothetical protein TCON_1295 [Thelohania contejeani]